MMMRKVFRAHKVKLIWQDEVVGVMLSRLDEADMARASRLPIRCGTLPL